MSMTPQQLIRYCILDVLARWEDRQIAADLTGEQVDELYEDEDELTDAKDEVRQGTHETGIPAPSSRHYESMSVAAQAPNGQWVGWTYWYGGGKYGEPEAIDWMGQAYPLDCASREEVVVTHTFTLPAGWQ